MTSKEYNLRVTDISGKDIFQNQVIATEVLNEHSFDHRKLPEGVYMLHLKNLEGEMVQKIEIE